MTKSKIVPFPARYHAEMQEILRRDERSAAKYYYEMKRLNWFSAGLFTGIAVGTVIFTCVYYFLGTK